MKRLLTVLAAVALLAGCGSSGGGGQSSSAPTSSASAVAVPSVAPTPVDPNIAACTDAQTVMTDEVKPAFQAWHPDTDEFDKKFGEKLRGLSTRLYTTQRTASGATADAIGAEAKGLTDLSIAISEEDDDALGAASNAANSALAQLRGVCKF